MTQLYRVARVLFLFAPMLLAISAFPQTANHRVVMDVTTVSSDGWALALTDAEALIDSFGLGNVTIEMVIHGPALSMLHRDNVDFGARIERLSRKGVQFVAGGATMRRSRAMARDLFPFAEIVDSGPAEVVRRQEAGWSYMKAGF